jgi:hypothetical protein
VYVLLNSMGRPGHVALKHDTSPSFIAGVPQTGRGVL